MRYDWSNKVENKRASKRAKSVSRIGRKSGKRHQSTNETLTALFSDPPSFLSFFLLLFLAHDDFALDFLFPFCFVCSDLSSSPQL